MTRRASTAALLALAVAFAAVPIARAPAQAPHTLREIMGELGAQFLDLTDATLRDDFGRAGEAAAAIAAHPLPEPIVIAVEGTLGPDFGAFETIDRASHDAALALADAARAGDAEAVAREHAALFASCVACHEQFRARLAPLSD